MGCPGMGWMGTTAVSHPPSLCSRRCRLCSLQLLPQPPGAHGVGREPELPPAAQPGQQPHLARRPQPAPRRRPRRQTPAAAGHRGLAGTPTPHPRHAEGTQLLVSAGPPQEHLLFQAFRSCFAESPYDYWAFSNRYKHLSVSVFIWPQAMLG